MYKDFDSDYGYLVTFNFDSKFINFSGDKLQYYAYHNYPMEIYWAYTNGMFHPSKASESIRLVNKKDIFNKIYDIGNTINKNIKDLKFIGLDDSAVSLFRFPIEDIIEDSIIMDKIRQFVEEYGFSESELGPRINRNETSSINDPLNGIKDSEEIINGNAITIPRNTGLTFEKVKEIQDVLNYIYITNPLIYHLVLNNALKSNSIKCTFDVLPFINLCLMIYFIKRFKYGLLRAQKSTIYNLSEVFNDLKEKYGIDGNKDKNSKTDEEKTYNGETRKKVITYVNYLQDVAAKYIDKYFLNYNYEIPVYPNLKGLIDNNDVDDPYNIGLMLRTTRYIIRTPIIAAYDYLIQTLNSETPIDRLCDYCEAQIYSIYTLCHTCFNIYANQKIQKLKKTGKLEYKKLEEDLNEYNEQCKTTLYPTAGNIIYKKYMDDKKSKKHYQKKKDYSNQS